MVFERIRGKKQVSQTIRRERQGAREKEGILSKRETLFFSPSVREMKMQMKKREKEKKRKKKIEGWLVGWQNSLNWTVPE